jgi:hypothetical protein
MLSPRHHAASLSERCSSRWWTRQTGNGELVAHASPECWQLCKCGVMRIGGYKAAHTARLPKHEPR